MLFDMAQPQDIALVLLNMGGPDRLEDIQPFLRNLFCDRELIRLPGGPLLQGALARFIAHRRSRKVTPHYAAIGGGSPLRDWTEKQAAGIAERSGHEFRPFVAMRYWAPTADDTVQAIRAAGLQRAVVLSMYPHYTGATTGSSINDFRRAVAQHHPQLECVFIEHWHDWRPYHAALGARICEGLEEIPPEWLMETRILFSAHALPQKFIDRGDPYLQHVQTTVAGAMEFVGGHFRHQLAFQSRSGPVRWMKPGTEETIRDLAAKGTRALLVVPVSFVSDHTESLHEIDI